MGFVILPTGQRRHRSAGTGHGDPNRARTTRRHTTMNILRYIVTDAGGPLEIGGYGDTPDKGVLVHGDTATVFKTRRAAREAIDRTREYSEAKGFKWEVWRMRIARLDLPASDVMAIKAAAFEPA